MTSIAVIAHAAKELGGGLPELRKTLATYGISDPLWQEVPKSKYVPDGVKELLFASNDGKLHAYWMDKTEHGSWPFNVTKLAGDISFASEPVVADLDNDGRAEVIFGAWPRNGGRRACGAAWRCWKACP